MVNSQHYWWIGRNEQEPVHQHFCFHCLVVEKFCEFPLKSFIVFIADIIITKLNCSRMNATLEDNRAEIVNDSIAFGILLSIVISLQLISGVICVDTFNHAALRQITRIRIRYFQSLMRQEIGWYDVAGGSNNFAVRLTE